MNIMRKYLVTLVAIGAGLSQQAASQDMVNGFQVSGRPVPELAFVDNLVTEFLDEHQEDAFGFPGAVVGIMQDERVVYLRGFGYSGYFGPDGGYPMPENAVVRIASVNKSVTAAAMRHLIDNHPSVSLESNAFNLGQVGGGLLTVNPFGGQGDSRLDDVTVDHLLHHLGGWDRSIAGDLTYRECDIADDYNVSGVPGRTRTMNWILGQPLQYTPGSPSAANTRYANIGFLAAGLIIEQYSQRSLINYIRSHILTPSMWIPSSEIRLGRSLLSNADESREPFYATPFSNSPDVFENCNQSVDVSWAYGGYHHEARVGQGGLIASAPVLLQLAQHFQIGNGQSWPIGTPRATQDLSGNQHHRGDLAARTTLYQRPDGINVFAFFNSSYNENGDNLFSS
jgi:hypothetical protein